LVKEGI
jgi:hypothetical protein